MEEYTTIKKIILGLQMLFVAFGAIVLVPLLVGIDPAVALFTAGCGTLIYHLITKRKVPIFLGSSFVFIVPIIEGTRLFGLPGTLCGLASTGLLYLLMAYIIKLKGIAFIERLFPPTVIGPVIMIIGLSLATTGVNMAKSNWLLAGIAIISAIVIVIFGKKMMKLLPIIGGIIIAYIFAVILGKVDFTNITEAAWLRMPNFVFPVFNINAIFYILPFAIAPIIEHIGDMYAISHAAKKNFIKDPGLTRTLSGDGIATTFAALFGGPPNTTYSEVTGAITLTRMTNPQVLRISALFAIAFAFIGKITGFLQTIPQAILGGVMILLFGMITVVGINALLNSKTNLDNTKNMVVVGVMLTIGIGGAIISIGNFILMGIGLATVVGILLNLLLPDKEKNLKNIKTG